MSNEEIQEELKQLIQKHAGTSWSTAEKASYFLRDFVLQSILPEILKEKDQSKWMTYEQAQKLVNDIFGNEAAEDYDIVSFYLEVNKDLYEEKLEEIETLKSQLSQLQLTMEEDIKFAQIEFATWLEDNTEVIREPKITLYRYHTTDGWANSTLQDIHLEYEDQIKKDYSSVTEFLQSLKSSTQKSTEGK